MSWLVPQENQGNTWLNVGASPSSRNTRTPAQQRAAAGRNAQTYRGFFDRSGGECLTLFCLAIGTVTEEIPAATTDGTTGMPKPTKGGAVTLLRWTTPAETQTQTPVEAWNPYFFPILANQHVLLGKGETSNDWRVMAPSFSLGHGTLSLVNVAANTNAKVGQLLVCSATGGSFTVTLPESAAGTEIGVLLSETSGSNKVTITATSTTVPDIIGKGGSLGASIELYVVGDYVRLKTLGGGIWQIVEDGRAPHACELKGDTGAGQGINNSAQTQIVFSTETYDIGGIGSTTSDQVTIRRAGRYQVNGFLGWDHPALAAGTGIAQVTFHVNGVTVPGVHQHTIDQTSAYISMAAQYQLSAGDVLRLIAFQNNGAARTLSIGTPPVLSAHEIL